MKILFFLIVYLINKIFSDYEKFDLTYRSPYYYIGLNFPDKDAKLSYILSTKIPKSFFPTSECLKCKEEFIPIINDKICRLYDETGLSYYCLEAINIGDESQFIFSFSSYKLNDIFLK